MSTRGHHHERTRAQRCTRVGDTQLGVEAVALQADGVLGVERVVPHGARVVVVDQAENQRRLGAIGNLSHRPVAVARKAVLLDRTRAELGETMGDAACAPTVSTSARSLKGPCAAGTSARCGQRRSPEMGFEPSILASGRTISVSKPSLTYDVTHAPKR
jgi:hypothetical protein